MYAPKTHCLGVSLLISEVIRSSSRFILHFQNCSKYFKYFAFWYELEHQFVRKPWCVALADFHGANTPTWPIAYSYSSAVAEHDGAGSSNPMGQWAHACWLQVHTHSSPVTALSPQLCGGREGSVLAGASAATRRGEGSTTAMGWFCSQGSWPQWLPLRQPRQAPGEAISPSVPVSRSSKVPPWHTVHLRVRSAPWHSLCTPPHTHHLAGSPQEDFSLSCPRPCSEICWRPLRKKQIYWSFLVTVSKIHSWSWTTIRLRLWL